MADSERRKLRARPAGAIAHPTAAQIDSYCSQRRSAPFDTKETSSAIATRAWYAIGYRCKHMCYARNFAVASQQK